MTGLKLHNFYPAHRVESMLLDRIAADAHRLSAGEISIAVHHVNSLGLDDGAALSWLPQRQADLALLWAVHLQRDNEQLRSAYIMGSARTIEEHVRALPELERLNRTVLQSHGIEPIAFFPAPVLYISVFAQKAPVTSLKDLRGRKLRVFSRDLEPTFGRLGIDARFIPQDQLYDALKAGSFDSTVYPACHTAWSVPLWRVTEHAAYLFPEALQPYVLAAPAAVWEGLGPRAREAVREAAHLAYPEFLRHSLDQSAELAARRNLASAGLRWHADFAPADQRTFTASAEATWQDLAAAAGDAAVAHRNRVLAAMGRGAAVN